MRARALALAVGALGLLAACASPEPEAAGCGPAEEQLVAALADGLTADGTLRYATLREGAGGRFLSAELHEPGDDDDEAGDILTVVVPDSGGLQAVDERAREHTGLPPSELTVKADGAVESRGCTRLAREEANAEAT